MRRDPTALESETFDLIVVGGGIVGACVAWDASLRGWNVVLLEKSDFGGGLSANSLKIVHGGLRYLQRLDVRRMRESIAERSTWLRIAPHLVEPLPVLVPTYSSGFQRRTTVGTAVRIADGLFPGRNRGLDPDRRLPPGRILSREEALRRVPELADAGPIPLDGAVLFHDAQVYSSERLVFEVVRAAVESGASAMNHVHVDRAVTESGRIVGVRGRDELTGDALTVRGRVVVVASGDASAGLASRLTDTTPAPPSGSCVGVNIVLDRPPPRFAVAFSSRTRDPSRRLGMPGRQLFLVPWRGRTMIGTGYYATGEPVEPGPAEPGALAERFLDEVRDAWPALSDLETRDVVRVHRGRLPLADGARSGEIRLAQSGKINDHAGDGARGLLSVTAVKLTTARSLAERVVDLVGRELGRPGVPCLTATSPLPGAPPHGTAAILDEAGRRLGRDLAPDSIEHLVRSYGRDYEVIASYVEADDRWRERVQAESPVIRAQLLHAVREEMACTADDVLFRRTEIGARGPIPEASRRAAEAILADEGRGSGGNRD